MNDERTTAYLLEELTELEAKQFEEQCFAQAEWPEVELESAEEDLIQAYIKNELSPERRKRFEENYLVTEARKERLLLARSFLLVACTGSHQPPRSWWQRLAEWLKPQRVTPRWMIPRFASVAVAIGLVAMLAFWSFREKTPQTFANLNLLMTLESRSASGPVQKVRLPIAEDALRISLTLPQTAPPGASYRVQWEDLRGTLDDDLKIEQSNPNSISVIIPAEKLKPGQYTLKLFQNEQRVQGSYHFNVD